MREKQHVQLTTAAKRGDVVLSIVIATYNKRDDLRACLKSVRKELDNTQMQIIVSDNGSTDGTTQKVKSLLPEVTLLENEANLGLSKANNRAYKLCTGRFTLLLDSDTVVQKGSIEVLLNFMAKNSDVAVASGRLLNPDGSTQITARNFPGIMNAIFGRHSFLTRIFPDCYFVKRYLRTSDLEHVEPYQVDWVSAAFMLIRTDVLKQVGGMDESFFVYWVDADLCRRVHSLGGKVYCVPQARIQHMEQNRPDTYKNPKMIIDFHRGVLRYYRKHHCRGLKAPLLTLAFVGLSIRCFCLLFNNLFKIRR